MVLVGLSPGPRVHSGYFEAVVPGTRVRSLPFRPGAHSVPVGLSLLPAAAVSAAVVEIEPPAVQVAPRGGRSRCSGGSRRSDPAAAAASDVRGGAASLARRLH